MSATLVILLMALVTYGPRLAGFALSGVRLPSFWLRFLHFVPITVFAALIVPALPGDALPGDGGEVGIRLVAATLAALALWRVKQLWLGIAVGMGAFWLLRALL